MAISIEQARLALTKIISDERNSNKKDDEIIELNNMFKILADINQPADEVVSNIILGNIKSGYIMSKNFQSSKHQEAFWIRLRSAAEAIIMDIDLNTVANNHNRAHFEREQRAITEKKQQVANADSPVTIKPAASSLG